MRRATLTLFLSIVIGTALFAQSNHNGAINNMGNIFQLSNAKTRSISPENFTGEPGKGGMATDGTGSHASRDLGQKWKVSPSVKIKAGETFTMAEIDASGIIQHIWMTPTGNWRFSILRFYWDGEEEPSVEVPVGDFFGMGWGEYAPLVSMPITVNPGSAFNSYWPMPFRKSCRVTMENISESDMTLYYQLTYAETEIEEDAAYFHAQFRREHPTEADKDYTIIDNIKGKGQYVGTYIAHQVNNNGWWGEGEVKFFMDGDTEFPTICGTGEEDYFCGSYNFDRHGQYKEFCTPYAGLHQVIRPDGTYRANQRFGMYRWHITDPIRFEKEMKVTMQDLGWRDGGRYLQQRSDIASVAYWYQTEPHNPFPKLPSKDDLEVQ